MDHPTTGPERGTQDVAAAPEAAHVASEDIHGPPSRDAAPKEERSRGGNERRVEVVCENEQWTIRESAGRGPERAFPAREKAVAQARTLAQEQKAVLMIYDEEGTIEEQQDYGTMGVRPNPEADVTGKKGVEATARAEERTMHRG